MKMVVVVTGRSKQEVTGVVVVMEMVAVAVAIEMLVEEEATCKDKEEGVMVEEEGVMCRHRELEAMEVEGVLQSIVIDFMGRYMPNLRKRSTLNGEKDETQVGQY
ncbi:hypothetical protein CRG98_037110 [Punica granatum]|uniref:Uncharacterized protein n=1 Tax=Punica granatum TaxID=22663 RepID=A0A2I0IEU3_PUNGR|nr:hypothetical protein CRG98_037110 [Punica granatum]